MQFRFMPITNSAAREAIFRRMQTEGLVQCAMSALASPTLAQWLQITAPERGVLLGCRKLEHIPASDVQPVDVQGVLACAMFTPRRGKVWEFDFTTFRATAKLAVPMARKGLAWAFDHLDCAAVMGLCPAPNRHAWRLAEACGFRMLGRLPGACWIARKQSYADGVLVLCTPQDIAPLR